MDSPKDGKPRATFMRSAQSDAFARIRDKHNGRAVYARQQALATVRRLRAVEHGRELAREDEILRGFAHQYRIYDNYVGLFVELVKTLINKDRERPVYVPVPKVKEPEVQATVETQVVSAPASLFRWKSLKDQGGKSA